MKLIEYKNKLNTAILEKDTKLIEELFFELEYSQLLNEVWDQEFFDFFISFLKDKAMCAANGSAALIAAIYNDFEKHAEEQKEILLLTFLKT